MARILIVEDDRELSCMLVDWFSTEGHVCEPVYKGSDALQRIESYEYDLVIVDWILPGLSGLELCRQYKGGGGRRPIFMLTAKSDVDDIATGLDAGADAYLIKPFHMRELSARVRALLRSFPAVSKSVLRAGNLTLNPMSKKVSTNNQSLDLQPREFALLEFLLRHPGQPFSAQTILDRVWAESKAAPDTVRIHIMKLRSKIDEAGKDSLIRTVHRVGYMLVPPPSSEVGQGREDTLGPGRADA